MSIKKVIISLATVCITIAGAIFIIYPFFLDGELVKSNVQNYSSLILAFLTFVYVILTYLILKSNNEAIGEQLRPYVLVTFPLDNTDIYFTIKNIGKRPAHEVNIQINPGLDILQNDYLKGNYRSFLTQSFIAPEQEIKCYLCDAIDVVDVAKKNNLNQFIVTLYYLDKDKNPFKESYQIDFKSYINEKDAVKPNLKDYLKDIQKELNSFNQKVDEYLRKK